MAIKSVVSGHQIIFGFANATYKKFFVGSVHELTLAC